ncbi:alpha/beta fold hydrolase [Burkholderia sp. Ac-20379]|uniref:alpha/beta fold hydrolase n=1 Tax=Burkholderia sp. Ac-20379 TaxID=2703900 RepID=UPI001F11D393|nr:alpha/beta fold hydrolase [Burkholderia sp. Ac-20379]
MRIVPLARSRSALPTLICLPGAMCSPLVYEEAARLSGLNADALAWLEDDGAFALDAIARRIVDALPGGQDLILVGHSLGTPLAVLAALAAHRRADVRIRGLVLANSGANTKGHGDASGIVRRIEAEWGEPMWQAFAARCFRTLPAPPLRDEIVGYPKQLRSAAVAQAIRSQIETDLLPLLPGLPAMPAAVVHGAFDVARTLAHAEELAGAIPGAALHVLQTGHTSCAEAPGEFAGIVREVAERAAGSR